MHLTPIFGLLELIWRFGLAGVVMVAFTIWMLIDAVRRGEWIWALFIFLFPGINALLYYFLVYRNGPSATLGFELPGSYNRKRIKELEAQIHHLDKAHHHLQLGDIYFHQGKLAKAEACYRASLERDDTDIDARAHLGQCLLRLKRPAEARPILEQACAEVPDHDYGHTMMALAETLSELGDKDGALKMWEQITAQHSYARAKVQYAELLIARGDKETAKSVVAEVLADDVHAPAYQRRRDRTWIRKAKGLLS